MSACSALVYVRFGPKVDIGSLAKLRLEVPALIDFLLCLQQLLNFTRFIFSALCFALRLRTLFFFTSLSLKSGLCSPSSFAVEKSLVRVHQSPLFGALIFPISQKYALTHIIYIGVRRLAAVEPERDAVSRGKAANGQCPNCHLLLPDLHTLTTRPTEENYAFSFARPLEWFR